MTPLSETLLLSRARAGLEQKDVAARLGVSQQMVSKWERGKARPAAKHLEPLATLLGIPYEELIGLAGHATPAAASTVEQMEELRSELAAQRADIQSLFAELGHLADLMALYSQGGDDTPEPNDPRLN